MGPLWIPHADPVDSPYGTPMDPIGIACAFLRHSLWIPSGFPVAPHVFPLDSLQVDYGSLVNSLYGFPKGPISILPLYVFPMNSLWIP